MHFDIIGCNTSSLEKTYISSPPKSYVPNGAFGLMESDLFRLTESDKIQHASGALLDHLSLLFIIFTDAISHTTLHHFTRNKMPVLTGVRPKLVLSGEGSETPCADCGMTSVNQIIEMYVVSKEGGDDAPTVTRKDLCGNCMVGHDVAVQRPSDSDWCFGEVKEYDPTKLHPFRLSFLDDKEEWAGVSPTPTRDYLKFINVGSKHQKTPQSRQIPSLQMMDHGSIGSFASSSFSSMSTFDGDNALPLFDDANLLHVPSFSLDDDKKGSPLPHSCGLMTETKTKPKTASMWTKEEDVNLKTVVNSFEKSGKAPKWPDVAKLCGSRNGKQCRERWCVCPTYLDYLSLCLFLSLCYHWRLTHIGYFSMALFRQDQSSIRIAPDG